MLMLSKILMIVSGVSIFSLGGLQLSDLMFKKHYASNNEGEIEVKAESDLLYAVVAPPVNYMIDEKDIKPSKYSINMSLLNSKLVNSVMFLEVASVFIILSKAIRMSSVTNILSSALIMAVSAYILYRSKYKKVGVERNLTQDKIMSVASLVILISTFLFV